MERVVKRGEPFVETIDYQARIHTHGARCQCARSLSPLPFRVCSGLPESPRLVLTSHSIVGQVHGDIDLMFDEAAMVRFGYG